MHSGASLAGSASLEDRRLRLLWLALLASLALHVLFLFLLPLIERTRAERSAPPPITAHLAKPEPPKAAQPASPQAEPTPRQAVRPPQLPPRRPAPQAAPRSQPAPVPSTAPATPVTGPAPVVTPPAPPAPLAKPEAPPAPSEASSAPDPGNLARYRLELLTVAKRYERYPRIARDNSWEGQVGLRIAISDSGALAPIAVIKSSGRTVLDDEGKSMIRSAHPQVPLPPSLRGKAFGFDVYINFRLQEER